MSPVPMQQQSLWWAERAHQLSSQHPLRMVPQEILVQRQSCIFPGRLWETLIALLQMIGWEEERERGRMRKQPHLNPAQWIWEQFASGSAVGKQRCSCLRMLSELSWAGKDCWGPPLVSGVGTAARIHVFLLTDRSVRGERCCTQTLCVFGAERSLFRTCTHKSSTFVYHFTLMLMPKLLLWPVH